jgi:predicted NAD-dependent protein-ADP-ribosyltransferase YbiA (DUF1768 family)
MAEENKPFPSFLPKPEQNDFSFFVTKEGQVPSFTEYLDKVIPKVVDPAIKDARVKSQKAALDRSMQDIATRAKEKQATPQEIDIYNHYVEKEKEFQRNILRQFEDADDLRMPLIKQVNSLYDQMQPLKTNAWGGMNPADYQKYFDKEATQYRSIYDPATKKTTFVAEKPDFTRDYNEGKESYFKNIYDELNNVEDYYEKQNYDALYKLADYIQGPMAKGKSGIPYSGSAFYNNKSLLPAQELANKVRAIANSLYFKTKNPNVPLSNIVAYPKEFINSFGKDMLAKEPGSALYGKGQREEFETADPENANAQRINFSADLLGLKAIKDIVDRDKTQKLAALARAASFNDSNPLNKINLEPLLKELEESDRLESEINKVDFRDYLKKNYAEAFKELELKEQKQKIWDIGYNPENLNIISPTNLASNILDDVFNTEEFGKLAARLDLSVEGGFKQLSNDLIFPIKSAISAGSIFTPEYVMTNTLDKFDDIGYNIGINEKGEPVSSGKFRWKDQDGETHYNGWAAIETGIPVGAQMAISMLVTKTMTPALTRVVGSLAPNVATFGSVFLTSYPKIYLEEYNNFKDSSDAASVATMRSAVEALTESIIPNAPDLLTSGTRSLIKGVTTSYERELAGALSNTVRGLFPGMTNKAVRRILDSRIAKRAVGITKDIAQEAIVEEELALVGNHFVDQYAVGLNPEYVTQNDLTVDNIIDTGVEAIAGMALTAFAMGGGTKRADNFNKAIYRWKIANNPDHYISYLTNQLDANKITQEEYLQKVGQIRKYEAELKTLPININSVRDMKTLLQDKDAQAVYFSNILEKQKLLNYVPTEEEKEEYTKQLEEVDRQLYKTEQAAGLYENLTTEEKNKIVADNYERKRKDILESEDLSPALLDHLIEHYKKDQKQNPKVFAFPLTAHITSLEKAREATADNFFKFIVNNNQGLTFEQLDYKIGLLSQNAKLYNETQVATMKGILGVSLLSTAGPIFAIEDENQFIEALARNYVTVDKNKRPLVSNGRPLLHQIREGYIQDTLFSKFVKGLEGQEREDKLTDLKEQFFERVAELKAMTDANQPFPPAETAETVSPEQVPSMIEEAFTAYQEELSQIEGDAEEQAAARSEIKAKFVNTSLGIIRDNFTSLDDLFNRMEDFFKKVSPETAAESLQKFKEDFNKGTISRSLYRVMGKGVPADFIQELKTRLSGLKAEPSKEGEAAPTVEEEKQEEQQEEQEETKTSATGVVIASDKQFASTGEKIAAIEEEIKALTAEMDVEKERLAFLDTLLEEEKAIMRESVQAAEKELKEFSKITAPKGSKRSENIANRRSQLEQEVRSHFTKLQSIIDSIREVENNLKRISELKRNLQNKSNYYKSLVASGQATIPDIWEKIYYLDNKIKGLNKLVDKAKRVIEKLKQAISNIAEILSTQKGILEEGQYPTKEQVQKLSDSIDFATSTEEQLNNKEKELESLVKATQNAEVQLNYLFELLEYIERPDAKETLDVTPEEVIVPETFAPEEEFVPVEGPEETPTKGKKRKKGSKKVGTVSKQQVATRDKLINANPEAFYLISLTDGTKVEAGDFNMLGPDYIEGFDRDANLIQIPVATLKSARKLKDQVISQDPNIDQVLVETDEDTVLGEWEEKDNRILFPQSGFITSSDEFDKEDEEVEDDYSQAVNAILKNITDFPSARITSMQGYLEKLMGPDIIAKISSVLDSAKSIDEKFTELSQIFTEYNKPIFYTKTLAWWAENGLKQFNEDLKAPAFFITDKKGNILRYTPQGLNSRGIPIHRNLPKAGGRIKGKAILEDYLAIKVDFLNPIIQKAIIYMDDVRTQLKNDPSLVFVVPDVELSRGAIKEVDGKKYKLVPTDGEKLLVVGTDVEESESSLPKGYIVGYYQDELTRVVFPKLTEEQAEVIRFIAETPNNELPKELNTAEKKLQYINNLVYTNPRSQSGRISFQIVEGRVVASLDGKVIYGQDIVNTLKDSYLNFNHTNYNKYSPFTTYTLDTANNKLVAGGQVNYKDFVNSQVSFFVPLQTRFNRKFYFGQPVLETEFEEETTSTLVDQEEPFVELTFSDVEGPAVPDEALVPDEEFVPLDLNPISEVVETLEKEEEAAKETVKEPTTLEEQEFNFPEEPQTPEDFDLDSMDGLFRSRNLPRRQSEELAKKALEWFESSEIGKLVDVRRLFNVVNSQAYAAFTKGLITLYEGSSDIDLYHESWHVFSQYFLTRAEKIELYKNVQKKIGNVSFKEAEEYLAEGYQDYAIKRSEAKPKNAIEKIYDKIYKFIQRIFNNPQFEINKMFEALYTGNINQYAPSENNFMFKELFSGRANSLNLKTPLGKEVIFSDRDLNELISNLDATIISQVLDNISERTNKRISLGTVLANKKNKKFIGNIYVVLKETLQKNLDDLKKQNKSDRAPMIERYEAILNDWNKVVKAHATLSTVLTNRAVSVYDEYLEDSQNSDEAQKDFAFNKSIEEFSSISRSKPEVIALVASIRKHKNNRFERTPLLGLPVLDNFTKNWKILSSLLANVTDYAHMLYKIEELAKENPEFNFLLESLPKYNQQGVTKGELTLKTAFINTFSEPIVDMLKVRLNSESVPPTKSNPKGETKLVANVIVAESRASTRVLKDWGMRFKTEGTEFTKKGNGQETGEIDINKVKEALKQIDRDAKTLLVGLELALELAENVGIYIDQSVTEQLVSTEEKREFIQAVKEYAKAIVSYGQANPTVAINDPINQVKFMVSKSVSKLVSTYLKNQDDYFTDEASNPEGNYIYKKNQFHFMSKVASWINQPMLRLKAQYVGKDITDLPVSQTHEEYYPTFGDLLKMKPQLGYLDSTIDPFSYGSNWMSQLYDINGNRILNAQGTPEALLKVVHFGGTEYEQNKRLTGKKTTNLTSVDKLLTDIQGFLTKGVQENIRFGDKGSAYAVYIEKPLNDVYKQPVTSTGFATNIDAITPFTGDSWEDNLDGFMNHAVAEVLAINKARKLNKEKNKYKNYDKNGDKLRFLADIVDKETSDVLEGDNLHNAIDKLSTIQEKIDYITDVLYDYEVNFQFADYIKQEAEDLKNYIVEKLSFNPLEEEKFLRTLLPNAGKFSQFTTAQLLLAYTYYDTLHRIEQFKFFYRDPAFFKNTDDVFKRLSKYSATGTYMITSPDILDTLNSSAAYERKLQKAATGTSSPYTDKIRVAITKDTLVDSPNKDEYVELVSKELGIDIEEAKKFLEGYGTTGKGAERADGQGIATLDFYRFSKLTIGEWLPEQEAIYEKEVEIYNLYKEYKASLSNPAAAQRIARQINNLIEEQNYVFEPQKPQYAGPIADKFPVTHFEKFSIYPATPSLTLVPTVNSKGEIIIEESDLFKMVENMYQSNVDYLVMASGVKDSALMDGSDYQDFYDEKGNVNQQPLKVNEVYADFFKEQVKISPHTGIQEIIFPTQMRGLLFLDEAEKGKFDKVTYRQYNRFRKVLEELISVEKEKLKKQLGAKKDDFSDVSSVALSKFLERELKSKDVSSGVFTFLVTKNKEFVFDYNGSTERRSISSILDNIVYNRIIKQKLSGTNYIQGANLGNTPFTKATALQKRVYGTNDMRFYSKDYQYCDVKIAFSERYKPLLNIVWKGERIGTIAKLNSLLRDEEFFKEHGKKVTLVGARVPTQGLNSMERMRVVQFLPPSAGTLMLLPEEIVVKTGSDFDIDKLFVFEPTMDENGDFYPYISATEEIKIREKLDSLLDTYSKKKVKFAFQVKALKEKVKDERILAIIDQKVSEISKGVIETERNLIAEDVMVKDEEVMNTSELSDANKEVVEMTQDLGKDINKALLKIEKNFAFMSEIKNEINEATNTLRKIKYGRSNEFVDVIATRLGNPDILVKLILPNSNPDLQGEKDGQSLPQYFNNKTKYIKEATGSFTSLIKAVTSNQIFESFMVGKAVLGVAARMNKTHQITAQMNLYDTSESPYMLETNNENSLSMLRDKKGRFISSMFSQYINGLVDIAKGAWISLLGVNKIKGPVQMYIVKRGTNVEEAIAFTLQPSINDYANNISRTKSVFISALGLSTEKKDALYSVVEKYRSTLERANFLVTNKQGDILTYSTLQNVYDAVLFNPNVKPVNVWSSDKNGFEKLSNFYDASFYGELGKKTYSFRSPEHYYQAAKALFHGREDLFKEIMETSYGVNAKKIGSEVKASKEWKKVSEGYLEYAMRMSIENNPAKKKLLLSTGEAQITHFNPKGDFAKDYWTTGFPRLLMRIRNSMQPIKYSYFSEETLTKQLTNPTDMNQLLYLAQYVALEGKSSNYVSFDQNYSPDTRKESGLFENKIRTEEQTVDLPNDFNGLNTFDQTVISPFEGLTTFSADLQVQTNNLLKNKTVANALIDVVKQLKEQLPFDEFDYAKINGKLIDSLMQHIIHNHYKTEDAGNFFLANNLGIENISPLSFESPADVNLAKRYKKLISAAKAQKINLVKEFPVLKFFKPFFKKDSDFFTFIFTAGSKLTSMQKDEFKSDFVKLLNYNHENMEFAAEVRNFFSEMLETLYVSTGFQYFEGNTAPIIPESIYAKKVTKAIKEFLAQKPSELKDALNNFSDNFLLYNYSNVIGLEPAASQKSFNIYNLALAEFGIVDPIVEMSKGEEYFIIQLTNLDNNSVYLQLIEKTCD